MKNNDSRIFLIKRAKNGDAESFIQLCKLYQDVLYNSAYRILLNDEDVADCLQETEIRAWANIKKLKNELAFNTWLFQIMINVAKTMLKKREDIVPLEHENIIAIENSPFELRNELSTLPEIYRIPIVLYYYAGFSIEEISKELKVPKNTIKTRLARGRKQLKKILGGSFNE